MQEGVNLLQKESNQLQEGANHIQMECNQLQYRASAAGALAGRRERRGRERIYSTCMHVIVCSVLGTCIRTRIHDLLVSQQPGARLWNLQPRP